LVGTILEVVCGRIGVIVQLRLAEDVGLDSTYPLVLHAVVQKEVNPAAFMHAYMVAQHLLLLGSGVSLDVRGHIIFNPPAFFVVLEGRCC